VPLVDSHHFSAVFRDFQGPLPVAFPHGRYRKLIQHQKYFLQLPVQLSFQKFCRILIPLLLHIHGNQQLAPVRSLVLRELTDQFFSLFVCPFLDMHGRQAVPCKVCRRRLPACDRSFIEFHCRGQIFFKFFFRHHKQNPHAPHHDAHLIQKFSAGRIFPDPLSYQLQCLFHAVFSGNLSGLICISCDLFFCQIFTKTEQFVKIRFQKPGQRRKQCDVRIGCTAFPLIDSRGGHSQPLCHLLLSQPSFSSFLPNHILHLHNSSSFDRLISHPCKCKGLCCFYCSRQMNLRVLSCY